MNTSHPSVRGVPPRSVAETPVWRGKVPQITVLLWVITALTAASPALPAGCGPPGYFPRELVSLAAGPLSTAVDRVVDAVGPALADDADVTTAVLPYAEHSSRL